MLINAKYVNTERKKFVLNYVPPKFPVITSVIEEIIAESLLYLF